MSSSLVVQLKLKFWLKKPTNDDIIDVREFSYNCLLKDIKGSECCIFKVRQYICHEYKKLHVLYQI